MGLPNTNRQAGQQKKQKSTRYANNQGLNNPYQFWAQIELDMVAVAHGGVILPIHKQSQARGCNRSDDRVAFNGFRERGKYSAVR